MTRKAKTSDQSTNKKSTIVLAPGHKGTEDDEDYEEAEITAQINVPKEGGWGWVVVAASFTSIMILDGCAYTFGSLLADVANDLKCSKTLVALCNSVAVALYLMAGPLVSAFINRFGFRACSMTGSIFCSYALLICHFVNSYGLFITFYGVMLGIGYSLINMSASLVVGFYFERYRSIALSITSVGSSTGVMTMFPLNSLMVEVAGWRTVILLQSGLFGLIYFLGMAYRPLLSLTLVKTADDPTKTVTYLPSVAAVHSRHGKVDAAHPAERLLKAIGNDHFPTAAAVIKEENQSITTVTDPGPSNAPGVSRMTLAAQKPKKGAISTLQLQQIKTVVSHTKNVDIKLEVDEAPRKKTGCCGRLCQWDSHIEESRPMYRDDAFYEGKVQNLPVYQKSMYNVPKEQQTGLEYQMAVSRAATTVDLKEKRGIFTTAIRRILATMMDPKLLQIGSFKLFCFSGFLVYLGALVPYVYIKDRDLTSGLDESICTWLVSVIGLANACGRLILGSLATKFNPVKMFGIAVFIAGVATMFSDLNFSVYYQLGYCAVFGFCISTVACLRSMIIVSLYGLDKLTNATGIILLFQGMGNLISTPLAGVLKDTFGYKVSFMVAGFFIALSGICTILVNCVWLKENANSNTPVENTKNSDKTASKV